jgi:uncharacterized protein (TIGR02453 family)
MPVYFSKDFHQFFKELAANNHKDWMDENRKRYTQVVKQPFEKFIQAIQEEVSQFDEEILVKPGDAIFRINRDIRFSTDKTPYKTNRTAIISKYGRKDKIYPGFYVFVSPEKVMIGGGAYFLEKDDLFKVRQEIAYNLDEFQNLISDKAFNKHFPEILGEKNKALPKEFKDDALKQPLLYNKEFYYMTELSADTIFKEDVVEQLTGIMQTAKPFNDFLRRALT